MASERYLILRTHVYAETDLMVETLSRLGERKSFTAKNAVNSKRRFAGGVLEPLNYVELQCRQTQKNPNRSYIEEAKCLNSFPGLRSDYRRLERAFSLLKIMLKITQEGLFESPEFFDLLGNTLKSLESSKKPELLGLHFKMKCLFLSGILAPDQDTTEFIARPVSEHELIRLTDEELSYLVPLTDQRLKELIP